MRNLRTNYRGESTEISGMENRVVSTAARDRYEEAIDAVCRLKSDCNEHESSAKIAALYDESMFHCGGSMKDSGLPEKNIYVDAEDNDPTKTEYKLRKRV